jgi:hypothetical protein
MVTSGSLLFAALTAQLCLKLIEQLVGGKGITLAGTSSSLMMYEYLTA